MKFSFLSYESNPSLSARLLVSFALPSLPVVQQRVPVHNELSHSPIPLVFYAYQSHLRLRSRFRRQGRARRQDCRLPQVSAAAHDSRRRVSASPHSASGCGPAPRSRDPSRAATVGSEHL